MPSVLHDRAALNAYVAAGAPYGYTPHGFTRWYREQEHNLGLSIVAGIAAGIEEPAQQGEGERDE